MLKDTPEAHMVARAAQSEQTRELPPPAANEPGFLLPPLSLDLLRVANEPPGQTRGAYALPDPAFQQISGPTRAGRTHTKRPEKRKTLPRMTPGVT